MQQCNGTDQTTNLWNRAKGELIYSNVLKKLKTNELNKQLNKNQEKLQ